MLKIASIFLDVFKICEKRCIKYNSKFINFTEIKHAQFAEPWDHCVAGIINYLCMSSKLCDVSVGPRRYVFLVTSAAF